LEVVNFFFLLVNVLLNLYFSLFIFRSLIKNSLLFLIVFLELLVLGSEMLVDVDQVVDFLVEDINIGEKVVVLFLTLDEGVLDLENVGQSCGFFDGIESLVNDFHVSLIIVDKFHFFLVVDDQLGQSLLQNASSIVLNSTDFTSFDSAASVESRVS